MAARRNPGHSKRRGRTAHCQVTADPIGQCREVSCILRGITGFAGQIQGMGSLDEKVHAGVVSPDHYRDWTALLGPIGTLDLVTVSGDASALIEPLRRYTTVARTDSGGRRAGSEDRVGRCLIHHLGGTVGTRHFGMRPFTPHDQSCALRPGRGIDQVGQLDHPRTVPDPPPQRAALRSPGRAARGGGLRHSTRRSPDGAWRAGARSSFRTPPREETLPTPSPEPQPPQGGSLGARMLPRRLPSG